MPKIVSTEIKDRGFAIFLRAEVALDDESTVSRQIEAHGDAAVVLPYDPDRRTALLVKLFRAPILYAGLQGDLVEAIAGMIDGDEAAEAAARREALEEAGVRLGPLEQIACAWSSPGVSTERMTLFLAPYTAADRVGPGGGLPEEHEDITVLETPLDRLDADLSAGRIDDMKLLALVQALKLRRPELFG